MVESILRRVQGTNRRNIASAIPLHKSFAFDANLSWRVVSDLCVRVYVYVGALSPACLRGFSSPSAILTEDFISQNMPFQCVRFVRRLL